MAEVTDVGVLVSGGTRGLGYAMSEALVAGGAQVVVTGRDSERAAAAAEQLGIRNRGRAIGIAMDVRDEQSVNDGVAAALKALGGIDVLVNNAGIGMRTVNPRFMTDPQPFWAVDPERFRDLFATNVSGYFLLARVVAPLMVEAAKGKIINVSVNEATTRRAGFFPYGPSRAATDSLSHVMAADLAGTGVTVNLLAPGGGTATGMVPDDVGDEVRSRLLDPAIMGPPILWLASADSDGITDSRVVATDFADGVRPAAS
ncbi:MAG TPA: SDR family oxidoreductase [Acidimicrobiales bacterium]|nr:SDR family oxidoreductase [Acidimicrobiales bacterium]